MRTVSREATSTARQIVSLREEMRGRIKRELGRRAASGLVLLKRLFRQPYVNVRTVGEVTQLSQPAANSLTTSMAEIGVLREITGKQSYRVFEFQRYIWSSSKSAGSGDEEATESQRCTGSTWELPIGRIRVGSGAAGRECESEDEYHGP